MKIKTATFIGIVIGTVGLMLTCSQPGTEGGHNLRSAARTGDEQNSSDDHMGFRICLDYIKR